MTDSKTFGARVIIRDKDLMANIATAKSKLWMDGKLAKYVQISPEEEDIAKLAPWQGRPALIAADGLFGFKGK